MNRLIEKIKDLTPKNTEEAIETITSMVGDESAPILLDEEDLLKALSIKGEYLLLKLRYEDFADELKYEKIKYKISQSLSIVTSYEDDGKSFEDIEKFVNYISTLSTPKQNAIFGIQKVEKLSEYPIKILFSGILPINQLKIHISQDIYDLIHADEDYFIPRFREFREVLSEEIGVPILPVFPKLDTTLKPTEAMLIDLVDGRVVSRFSTAEDMNKLTIEVYLQKLFYIYLTLANKKCLK